MDDANGDAQPEVDDDTQMASKLHFQNKIGFRKTLRPGDAAHCTHTDTCAGLSMDDANGDAQPEANGNTEMEFEPHAHSTEEDMPDTHPHAQAPQETPNLLDQPRLVMIC